MQVVAARLDVLTRRAAPRLDMQLMRRLGAALIVLLAMAIDLLVWGGERGLRGGGLLSFWVIPVATCGVFTVLLWRWRQPIPVFWLQWVYGLTGLFVPGYQSFFGLLVALHAVASRCRPRIAAVTFAACIVPFGINSYNSAADRANSVATFATAASLWAVLTAAVWGLARLTYAADRRADLLQKVQEAQAARALQEERLRLARELHDVVANAVSAMILQAAGARRVGAPDNPAHQALAVIESAGVQAMRELHRLLGLLRSSEDAGSPKDTGNAAPGLADLPELLQFARQSGLRVDMVRNGVPQDLDVNTSLTVYRIVQEALANIAKHAGRAARTCIEVGWQPDHLTVTVRNTAGLAHQDRPSIGLISSGQGLKGLQERARLIGGQIHAHPLDDGFLVQAHLPLHSCGASTPLPSGAGSRKKQ